MEPQKKTTMETKIPWRHHPWSYRISDLPVVSTTTNVWSMIMVDNCFAVKRTCPGTYHLECLDPPLKSIQLGDWRCPQCRYRDPTSKKMLIKLNIGGSKTSVQMAGSDKPSKKKLIKLNIGGSKTAVQTAGNVKPSLMFGSANHGASVTESKGVIRNKCKSGTSPRSLLPCRAHAIISSAFDENKNASGCFAGKVDPCIIFKKLSFPFQWQVLDSLRLREYKPWVSNHSIPVSMSMSPDTNHTKSSKSSDQISTIDLLCSHMLLIILFSRIYDNGGHLLCCETFLETYYLECLNLPHFI